MVECECKQEGKIAMLEQRDMQIMESLNKMETKMDLILTQVTKIAVLESNHDHQKAAIDRAFDYVRKLEREIESSKEGREKLRSEFDAFVNQVAGMKLMGYWIWTLMGSGVVIAIFKAWPK